jgi:hypothetical protein
MATFIYTKTFTADASGGTISFLPIGGGVFSIELVSIKKEATSAVDSQIPINQFLTGTTDNGNEINFRVDTPRIQLMTEFETFANPLAVMTQVHRGSLIKCFVALDDGDFYELEGNAVKGVSLVKIHSQKRNEIETPPIAREIRISWRDSSNQLCQIIEGEIVFLPTTLNYVE